MVRRIETRLCRQVTAGGKVYHIAPVPGTRWWDVHTAGGPLVAAGGDLRHAIAELVRVAGPVTHTTIIGRGPTTDH